MPEPSRLVSEDIEPDYRFTLANERTFLAWMRTSLALLAAAVAVVQFVPDLGSQTFRDVFGIVFTVLAAGSAAGGLWRWTSTQRTMRQGNHLRRGSLPVTLAVTLALLALGVFIVLVLELGQ